MADQVPTIGSISSVGNVNNIANTPTSSKLPNVPPPPSPTVKKPVNVSRNQYGVTTRKLGHGTILTFSYTNYKHDPNPLIIVTEIKGDYIRGLNMHYFLYSDIRTLLSPKGMNAANNLSFGYGTIKNNHVFVSAYREYKRMGIKNAKILNLDYVLSLLNMAREFAPGEAEAMRQEVSQQLNRPTNPNVGQL